MAPERARVDCPMWDLFRTVNRVDEHVLRPVPGPARAVPFYVPMNVSELREKYLDFFVSRDHLRVPSASLVPIDATGRLDESLLFTGAGMVQFKPYFRGAATPEHKRLTNAQKCIRTGDIEEVGDDTHLTFFEMMGNFSFGDYFKAQAIAYSWEFLTSSQWLALDPKRLAFSIYETDEEALEEWSRWLIPAGIDPEQRVFRLDEESNYWPAGSYSNGPPGPCGPNSEMFYWTSKEPPPSGPYTREQFLADNETGDWVEFWNDVFISYEWQGRPKNPSRPGEGYVKEGMPELPFRSIDTGMGLERTAIVLGAFKSVYDTDVFQPILDRIRSLAKNPDQAAERVVADHLRTASFCIAEAIFPSNNGRGYVLRRLIRRAVLKGSRLLGIHKPFLTEVASAVLDSMGGHYGELIERKETIFDTLESEEVQFRKTLQSGSALLSQELETLQSGDTISGSTAFRLYDTFGFPLEVTQEIAGESGIGVDLDGYEEEMKDAQERSKSGQERETVYGKVVAGQEISLEDAPTVTKFTGYDHSDGFGRIVRIKPTQDGARLALDSTPFYGESGGQVGDTGLLDSDGSAIEILGTNKAGGLFWHDSRYSGDPADLLGKPVHARIDKARRARVKRNHTATHLLHAALRQVLGTHVAQAGSYVGPESLRFDFSHRKAMSPEEVGEVERIVNDRVLDNIPVVTYVDIPIAEARAKGAMALFGEKYGNLVRLVEIGDFSRELCGGTHVRSTGEIGLFKILNENSAASGIRRIEAVTGEGAYDYVLETTGRVKQLSHLLKASEKELEPAIERLMEQLKDEKRRREKAEIAALRGESSSQPDAYSDVSGVRLWVKNFGPVDSKLAAAELDNAIAANPDLVGVVAAVADGKVSLFAKAGPIAVSKGAHAGNLVGSLAKMVGGGGGGRPDFASAGGRNPDRLPDALANVKLLLEPMIT